MRSGDYGFFTLRSATHVPHVEVARKLGGVIQEGECSFRQTGAVKGDLAFYKLRALVAQPPELYAAFQVFLHVFAAYVQRLAYVLYAFLDPRIRYDK